MILPSLLLYQLLIYFDQFSQNMDDFDKILQQRQRHFQAGHQKGMQEANAYSMQEIAKEGQQFGTQFVKELAMYESFLQTFQKLCIAQHLTNQKAEELATQIRNIIKEIDYKSLQVLKTQRATLQKKFQVFMAMLGIKKAVTRSLFQVKKVKVSIDF